jgi:hypothetical protein
VSQVILAQGEVAKYKAEATAHFLARVAAEKDAAKERAAAARLRKDIAAQKAVVHLSTAEQ